MDSLTSILDETTIHDYPESDQSLFCQANTISQSHVLYTFTNPRRQIFSLPLPFTNYIFKKYTAQLYQKLVITCKQFFSQKPLIVVASIQCAFRIQYSSGQKFLPTFSFE